METLPIDDKDEVEQQSASEEMFKNSRPNQSHLFVTNDEKQQIEMASNEGENLVYPNAQTAYPDVDSSTKTDFSYRMTLGDNKGEREEKNDQQDYSCSNQELATGKSKMDENTKTSSSLTNELNSAQQIMIDEPENLSLQTTPRVQDGIATTTETNVSSVNDTLDAMGFSESEIGEVTPQNFIERGTEESATEEADIEPFAPSNTGPAIQQGQAAITSLDTQPKIIPDHIKSQIANPPPPPPGPPPFSNAAAVGVKSVLQSPSLATSSKHSNTTHNSGANSGGSTSSSARRRNNHLVLSDELLDKVQSLIKSSNNNDFCSIPEEQLQEQMCPLWEIVSWMEYLLFLSESISREDARVLVDNLTNSLIMQDVVIDEAETNKESNDTRETLHTLLQGCHLYLERKRQSKQQQKDHSLTSDREKEKSRKQLLQQASIMCAIYQLGLDDYSKLEKVYIRNPSSVLDATASFFRACLPSNVREELQRQEELAAQRLLEEETTKQKEAEGEQIVVESRNENETVETNEEEQVTTATGTGESTSQSHEGQTAVPTTGETAGEVPTTFATPAAVGMVNHVGSLIRKRLNLGGNTNDTTPPPAPASKLMRSPLRLRLVGTKETSPPDDTTTVQSAIVLSKITAPFSEEMEEQGDDYTVIIHREMLGLTVENVLERTIIRTVLPHGAAKKSGAQVGSLIVQVGGVKTFNLTHFETIDELRQSNRPLRLVLRQISDDALREAREEMGRLIRGGAFCTDGKPPDAPSSGNSVSGISSAVNGQKPPSTVAGEDLASIPQQEDAKPPTDITETTERSESLGNDCAIANLLQISPTDTSSILEGKPVPANIVGLNRVVSYRWNLPVNHMSGSVVAEKRMSKRDKAISKVGERLVAILSFFLIGIDRELNQIKGSVGLNQSTNNQKLHSPSHYRQSFYDAYMDAGKTISKILYEYVSNHVQSITEKGRTVERCQVGGGTGLNPILSNFGVQPQKSTPMGTVANTAGGSAQGRPGKAGRRTNKTPGGQAGAGTASGAPLPVAALDNTPQSTLWQLGDVIHRARSFLADCSLEPALLIQTPLIGLLCDILDLDTEMELSDFDEESHSYNDKSSSTSSGTNLKSKATNGPQDELGCAGSLLKLIVRNSAEAAAASTISGALDENTGGNIFLAVVHRLAASRSTAARITACSLGPVLWDHLDFPHKLQLRGVITRALHDVEVIVRRSTAAVLHEIAELVYDPRSVPWLVLMCERAMTDPEPQLRAAAMTLTWHLAEHLPNAFQGDCRSGSRSIRRLPSRDDPTFAEVYLLQCKLLPVATRLAEDRAASVRLAVAAQCDRLCSALGEHWCSVIIDLLQALVKDSDERVRAEATLCLPRLVENLVMGAIETQTQYSVSVVEALLPTMLKCVGDQSSSVRAALATASGELLSLFAALSNLEDMEGVTNQELLFELKMNVRHVDDTLIPLLQKLLNDKDPEVTSAALRAVTNASRGSVKPPCMHHEVINGMSGSAGGSPSRKLSHDHSESMLYKKPSVDHQPVFKPVLSEGQVMKLLPTLTDLANSTQWRVRQSAVEIVPALLGCTQRLETRTAIAQLCVTLMGDVVDTVRRTAAECLCLGGGSLGGDGGGEWLREIVIPNLKLCRDSDASKQRMLCLKMVQVLVQNSVCVDTSTSHFSLTGKAAASSKSTSWRKLGPAPNSTTPLREILELAASLSNDKVVNVRLNVGRVLGGVVDELASDDDIKFVIQVLEAQIASEEAREKSDRDVLYFAQSAIVRSWSILEGNRSEPNTPTFSRPKTSITI